jgi:hypothetical protein
VAYRLTTDDKAIFRKAATENPSYFTDYYFGGWAFHDYQTPLHVSSQPEVTIIGGVGCLAPGTLIYDPVSDTETPVEEIEGTHTVLAWTGDGFTPAQAGEPYVKGVEEIYRVTMASGREIEVTGRHAFLTPNGYRRLEDLHVGSPLCSTGGPDPISSIEALDQSEFYDFHVPIYNNYVAHGLVHHNSGKTSMVAFSAATWAALTPYFKFMNVAPTFWQAKLMYQAIIERADGNRYQRFIKRAVRRPYPTIELYNNSKLEFMSAADEIEKLRGWEGDWMNGDEFGFIDSPSTVQIMRTRLRGERPTNRPRLGRLSVITTATDVPWLWERYDKAKKDPETYLSMTITTSMNESLTKRDVRLMREALPPELRAIEMQGARPMGTCEEFARAVIEQCEDRSLNRLCHQGIKEGKAGFAYEERSLAGCHQLMMPPDRGRDYLVVGDPGQGEPPRRNAGVVLVLDITGFPEHPATLRMFDWVYGGGSYIPFLSSFKTAMNLYQPVGAAFDATGSQKAMDELAFSDVGEGILVEGMNLTGKKQAYHNAIKLIMQRGLLKYPYIRGLRRQLAQYAFPDKKLTQDIVSALQIAGGWMRRRIFTGEMAGEQSNHWTIPLLAMSRDRRPSMRHSLHRSRSLHVRRR